MKVKMWPKSILWMSAFLLMTATFCDAAPTRRSRRARASTKTRQYTYSNYRTTTATPVQRSYTTSYAQPLSVAQPTTNYTVAQAEVIVPTATTTPAVTMVSPVATTIPGTTVGQQVVAPASQGSAIAEVNAIRARRGLPAFVEDASLSAVAYQKASIQANRGAMFHPGGSMGGARYEGVGYGAQFNSCYLYSNVGQYAGAATVVGQNGQRYHCLLVK